MNKVYVKNIPQAANESKVIETLSIYGSISNCELEKHPTQAYYNSGRGFVEFTNEKGANTCITKAKFERPKCMGRELHVSKSDKKKPKKIRSEVNDIKFTLSSLEVGNWGGQSSIVDTNRKGKERASESDPAPEKFTFLSEWKYPENYVRPTVWCSKNEAAFILEGFNLPGGSDIFQLLVPDPDSESIKKRVKISLRSLVENSRGTFLDERDGTISLYISAKRPPYLYRGRSIVGWVRTVDWTETNIFGRCLVFKLIFEGDLNHAKLRDSIADFRFIPRP